MAEQTTERQYKAGARGDRARYRGIVKSNNNAKTLVVAVERRVMHPKYKKYITRHTNLHAHDEKETAQVGDFVELVECRRMSKTKRFRLVSVLKKAGE
ncbi:MAG: 30S ribosomal protein S17 [Planctomycetes bacterium]|nr:30S ribosomal protein S17 [Planctomycetota bacterium]